jgi:hypothetical protein
MPAHGRLVWGSSHFPGVYTEDLISGLYGGNCVCPFKDHNLASTCDFPLKVL